MIKPYTAVGLIPTVRGIRKRKDIMVNLEHLTHLVKAAAWLSSLDFPVRLIAFPEGALQGFNDEVLDLDHVTVRARVRDRHSRRGDRVSRQHRAGNTTPSSWRRPRRATPISRIASSTSASSSTRSGKIILQALQGVAAVSGRALGVSARRLRLVGREVRRATCDAFWPVVDTEIGRLGIMMANEGSYPENARALAMNGAEVVYRASYPHPGTGNEFFEIQSRARALDNNMYVVAPNMGTYYLFPEEATPIDTFGGRSFIINYKGQIVGRQDYGAGSTYVGGVIDIEALRDHRARAQWDNWMKDLRTELYQLVYEQPIYPKNLYLQARADEARGVPGKGHQKQIDLMHEPRHLEEARALMLTLASRGDAGRRGGRGPRARLHGSPVAVSRSGFGSLGPPIPQRGVGRGLFELSAARSPHPDRLTATTAPRDGAPGALALRAARHHHAWRFMSNATA